MSLASVIFAQAILPALHGQDVFAWMATGAGKSLCMFNSSPTCVLKLCNWGDHHSLECTNGWAGIKSCNQTVRHWIITISVSCDAFVGSLDPRNSEISIATIRPCDDEKIKGDWYCCRKIPLGLVHALIIWSRFIPLAIINSSVMSPPWRSLLENDLFQQNLVLVAVDEAHCICEWLVTQSFYHSLLWVRFIVHRGPSLRKAFQKVGTFWSLTKAPFMALSASAPPAFERTTFSSLALSDPVFVKLPLNLLGQSQVLV